MNDLETDSFVVKGTVKVLRGLATITNRGVQERDDKRRIEWNEWRGGGRSECN